MLRNLLPSKKTVIEVNELIFWFKIIEKLGLSYEDEIYMKGYCNSIFYGATSPINRFYSELYERINNG